MKKLNLLLPIAATLLFSISNAFSSDHVNSQTYLNKRNCEATETQDLIPSKVLRGEYTIVNPDENLLHTGIYVDDEGEHNFPSLVVSGHNSRRRNTLPNFEMESLGYHFCLSFEKEVINGEDNQAPEKIIYTSNFNSNEEELYRSGKVRSQLVYEYKVSLNYNVNSERIESITYKLSRPAFIQHATDMQKDGVPVFERTYEVEKKW